MKNVINREASDKTKGFRLQKLRALKLMLESLEKEDKASFYTAIEDVEDVSHTDLNGNNIGKYYEEDKNYDANENFTIFSPSVKNTLVSFFDIFVHSWKSSDNVTLGFYTTASIGKERKKFTVDGSETAPPKKPILMLISSGEDITDEIAAMVKSVLIEEYIEQYEDKEIKGNLQTLEEIGLEEFKKFLSKISWSFGGQDEKELKSDVIELIKKSKFHNFRHENKEETVFAVLMELLDERQTAPNLSQKVVHAADIKYEFKKIESEQSDLVTDPAWTQLKNVEADISDKRNLAEKIVAVCPDYAPEKIKHLARLACRSKIEQEHLGKSFLSLKYRAFEACSDFFFKNKNSITTEADIDYLISQLQQHANQNVDGLKEDYHYPVCNSQAVNGLVVDLFDSCFISFEEAKK